ncbi:hypothetical protein FGIG_01168 [Fasciola gigantica]|uniref:Arb2 domain-containing protein n=1 Tax=Fasciola gigantica TaxID=46835 RepID=A0A504YF87_FASGI|nr:hypothetical protein FGIG_01168 [Fasciola gigantica]
MDTMMLRTKARDKSSRSSIPSESSACSSVKSEPAGPPDVSPNMTVEPIGSTSGPPTSSRPRSRPSDVLTDSVDRNRLLLASLSAMGLPNPLSACTTLLDLPASMRLLHPLFQNGSDFGYEFDSDGILRNIHTGETLAMKVTFTGAAVKRQELIRAICTRQVRQRLFALNMESSPIPIPGHPTLCMRVIHSRHLFTHRGPVLIILQAGGVAHAGVWANRLLLHPQHGLRTGSQLELIRQAHTRGFAVALVHANEQLTSDEAELESIDLMSTLCSLGTSAAAAQIGLSGNTALGSVGPDSMKSNPPQSYHPDFSVSVSSPMAASTAPVIMTARSKPPVVPKSVSIGTSTSSSMDVNSSTTSSFVPPNTTVSLSSTDASMLAGTAAFSNSALYTLLLLNGATAATSRLGRLVTSPSQVTATISTNLSDPNLLGTQTGMTETTHAPSVSVKSIASGTADERKPVITDQQDTKPSSKHEITQSELKPSTSATPAMEPISSSAHLSTIVTTSSTTCNPHEESVPHVAKSFCGTKCARDATEESFTSTTPHTDFRATNTSRITPWSWPIRPPSDHAFDLSPEDRLYGIWRQLVPRLLSDQIFVWAHQQGGHALTHPLKPMPGLWPGFSDDPPVTSHPKPTTTPTNDTVQRRDTPNEHLSQIPDLNNATETKKGVYSKSRTNANTSTLASASLASPSMDSTETVSKSYTKRIQTKSVVTLINANSDPGRQAIHQPSTGSVRPRVYATRKRHMSANAILSTCPSSAVVSLRGTHRSSLIPVGEHSQETINSVASQSTTGAGFVDFKTTGSAEVHMGCPGNTISASNTPTTSMATTAAKIDCTSVSSVTTAAIEGVSDRPELMDTKNNSVGSDRIFRDRKHTTSATRPESGEEMAATSCVNQTVWDSGYMITKNTSSKPAIGADVPPCTRRNEPGTRPSELENSGDQLKGREEYTENNSDDNTAIGDFDDKNEESIDSGKQLQLRLVRAWQQKARRLFEELSARVKCIVFTDCPTVLDLAMEGIGWGLHLLQDQSDDEGTFEHLYKPSAIRSDVPDRVRHTREWLSQNSVHFVAADTPIGTRLDEGARRTHPIPVLSAGTTEHDLIPSSVLETVFDLFDSKLNSQKKSDLTTSSHSVGTDNPVVLFGTSNRVPQSMPSSQPVSV